MTGPKRRQRSPSQYKKYYAGVKVTPGGRTELNFGCGVNSTLVVSDLFWGVHKEIAITVSYYLPGDCTAGAANLKSNCSKCGCTINTTAPVTLHCQSWWKGSKVPQYLHINYNCMRGKATNHIDTFYFRKQEIKIVSLVISARLH